MYEIFESLCATKGVTPYKVGKATGISSSTLSDWKNGGSKPKIDKLEKIADYFDVPVTIFTSQLDKESAEESVLSAFILNDKDLLSTLKKYFLANASTKKKILSIINLLCEE